MCAIKVINPVLPRSAFGEEDGIADRRRVKLAREPTFAKTIDLHCYACINRF